MIASALWFARTQSAVTCDVPQHHIEIEVNHSAATEGRRCCQREKNTPCGVTNAFSRALTVTQGACVAGPDA